MQKIPVGISSCLLGESVRFDGGHKRDAYIVGTLSGFFEFRPFCPEVAIGMGIPRPTIHLVKTGQGLRSVGVKDPSKDFTEPLRAYAEQQKILYAGLCGYILKKDSPSCGMARVKVYTGRQPTRDGVGVYAEVMMRNNPLMPVEEEGRLGDPGLRENFIQRVYVYYRWLEMMAQGLTPHALITFHARHKLIMMTHGDYRALGQLVAGVTKENLQAVAGQYIKRLMALLKTVPSKKAHVNVLQHIQGYLKKELSADDKAELCEVIERYRQGEVPLIVPITLLKHHFRKNPDPYIDNSYYLAPYPPELRLTNLL